MCGIAGTVTRTGNAERTIRHMIGALAHRGPDACGIWTSEDGNIALGHRRLSVVELSTAGAQPMVSSCGRYTIVYNGEVYNHLEVRAKLQAAGHRVAWRGHSDTETVLEAVAAWGIRRTLDLVRGMFAFAVFNKEDGEMVLARDRLGEKPLYIAEYRGDILFGSELSAFERHPTASWEIDRAALGAYVRYGYYPTEACVYTAIKKIRPGSLVRIGVRPQPRIVAEQRYWSIGDTWSKDAGTRCDLNELHDLLQSAVREQMLADVPVGTFLSGGVDSSLIAAVMTRLAGRQIKTFTIDFETPEHSEARYAEAVASALGAEHTTFLVSSREAIDVVPRLPEIFSEPFADSSQIPTYLVASLARREVTVVLTGDGSDELFGGYRTYSKADALWRVSKGVPTFAAGTFGNVVDAVLRMLGKRVGTDVGYLFAATRREDLYDRLVSLWPRPESVLIAHSEYMPLSSRAQFATSSSFTHWMMAADLESYLPGDILTKVDRAAMAVGLETRIPLLDYRIVEFAGMLPMRMKIRNGGKWAVRQLLHQYLPQIDFSRPKRGFSVPLNDWLRGPLRSWAEELISVATLTKYGYFRPAAVRAVWHEHLSGKRDHARRVWAVLMFNAWLEARGSQRAVD